ncbi:50S ribosomal protein L20, partial [Candidatus Latescibacterota bacterium]
WIARINAATRMRGSSYSTFISAMNKRGVLLNRKVLADLAVNDEKAFTAVFEKVMAST